MVPEILSVMDKIFCHFGPFFSFLPPKTLKNQNFKKLKEKKKKTPRDIINLYKCIKNPDHMPYCS